MIQSPPRRPSNVAPVIILGFFASAIVEFVLVLILDFGELIHSASASNVVSVCLSVVTAAVVGCAMFLARPRHYGLAAVAGVSAVVSAIIANELAIAVYFVVKRLPIGVRLFTDYFANPRAIFWISNVIMIVVAAGLTALRVSRVRAGEARATGMPPQPWGPPGQQWGPQPSYGPPQHGPQGPYGPPPGHPGPYGPPQPTQPPQPPQPPQQAPDRPASEPLG